MKGGIYTTLATNVAMFRERKGWSRGRLNLKMGAYRGTVCMVEREDNRVSIELAVRLANALGISVTDLLVEGGVSGQNVVVALGANIYEIIGGNVRAQRIRLGMTQKELADKVFTTQASICNYELGKSKMYLDMLLMIAEALGTTLEDLMTDHGVKKEKYLKAA